MGLILAAVIEEKRASKVLYSGMFIVILGRVIIIGGQATLNVPYGIRADTISLNINISNSIKTNTKSILLPSLSFHIIRI